MSSESPALYFVLVPGGYHVPAQFESLLTVLRGKGYDALAVPNVSTGMNLTGKETLQDDAANLRRVISELVERGKRVVVAGFSYGGMIATEALYDVPRSEDGEPGLVKIIFIASTMPEVGQTVFGFAGGKLPPWTIISDKSTYSIGETDAIRQFYHDVPQDTAHEAAKKLACQSQACFDDPVTKEAWTVHPCGYVICTEDQSFPPAAQRGHVESKQERSRYPIIIEEVPSSHSPFLSMPELLVEAFERILSVTWI